MAFVFRAAQKTDFETRLKPSIKSSSSMKVGVHPSIAFSKAAKLSKKIKQR